MVRCCVKQCPNIGVHRFTLDKNRREIWKEAIGEKNLVVKNHRLCTNILRNQIMIIYQMNLVRKFVINFSSLPVFIVLLNLL